MRMRLIRSGFGGVARRAGLRVHDGDERAARRQVGIVAVLGRALDRKG